MDLKNPNIISASILLIILLLVLTAAYFLYSEQPEGTIFQPADSEFEFPYTLGAPHMQIYLPDELREISGLSWKGNDQILAVQDEKGVIYTYDINQQMVVHQLEFGKDRDYEGVAYAGERTYILERDGDIFEIDSLAGKKINNKKYETPLSYQDDAEGLGYDPEENRLLVSLKEAQSDENETGEGVKRLIYSFDLKDHRLSEKPVYFIDQLELGRMIYHKEKSFELKPSGIAVHPKNGYIYAIASVGRILIVMDRTGQLLYAERLNSDQLPQPEGITFDPEGRLFLSSEARGGQARLLVFNPKQ